MSRVDKLGRKIRSGPDHWNWKGGSKTSSGYVYLYRPDYHRAVKNYAKRADLVLEEKIGRLLLPNEIAHHKNGDRLDDRPDNLEVEDRGLHQAAHNLERADRGVYVGSQDHRPRDEKGRWK